MCVSGACSRAGKTALAATLVGELADRGIAAVKFTTTDDVFERCPRGTTCIVCDIDVPFRIVEDEATLRQPGTDTERLGSAGATRVVWCIAQKSASTRAWAAVARRLGDASAVVEGSTVVSLAKPDLNFFVVHPFLSPSRWKEGSEALIASADCVIVNVPAAERRPPSLEVREAILRFRGRDDLRVADVTAPLVSWGGDLWETMAAVFLRKAASPRGITP